MNPMISYIMLFSIVVVGVGLVMVIGTPIIDSVKADLELKESEKFLNEVDKAVSEVSREGVGSTRIIKSGSGDFRISAEEDLIEYSQRSSLLDYLVRKYDGNLLFLSGSDVSCYESDVNNDARKDLVMENSYIGIGLAKVNGSYDTKNNIIIIKNSGRNIMPSDSSIIIDGGFSSGVGFSYLEKTGEKMSKCRVRYLMNSTNSLSSSSQNSALSYEIIYTLYNGADFLVVEVRNVK